MTTYPAGETDLARLLATLDFELSPVVFTFTVVEELPRGVEPFAMVREAEGLTLVLPRASAERAGLGCHGSFRRIGLMTHSSLEAVGLTAALSGALAAQGISANVIAGYFHDHIFVPAETAAAAVDCLRALRHGQEQAPEGEDNDDH